MLLSDPITKSIYTGDCTVCWEKQGFPLLCNKGSELSHLLCLDCVVNIKKKCTHIRRNTWPYLHPFRDVHHPTHCPVCRERFNVHDYLVTREIYLRGSIPTKGNVEKKIAKLEKFVFVNETKSKNIISQLYWGNNLLFYKDEDSTYIQQNKRIQENLLEILGNPWAPELSQEDKKTQLLEIVTNGLLVKPLQGETTETFLHRCHLFLRDVTPIPKKGNIKHLSDRMTLFNKSFRNYNKTDNKVNFTAKNLYLYNRPTTGPLWMEAARRYTKEPGIGSIILQSIKEPAKFSDFALAPFSRSTEQLINTYEE